MNRHLFLLIIAVLFSTTSAFAQGGECGENLTWNINGSTLYISGTGDMWDWQVEGYYPPWYEYRESINSVILETGVATIGAWAFYNCTNLTSVTIPNSVTIMERCSFYECTSLASITIPNSVARIVHWTFYRCTSLTSVIIPNNVTSIEYATFSQCTSLISVTIPNSVATIGTWAFSQCTSLTSVTIPNSVTAIGNNAFENCQSLTSINVESGNTNYFSENGVLFNKDKTTLICYPGGKTGAYVIPNSVTTIEESAFNSCSSLISITLPSSVTTIGTAAFRNCSSLTSITNLNPVPVEIIDRYIFEGVNQSECTLTVPTSAVSAYENAEVWQEFNIVGGGILVNPVSSNNEQGYVTGNGLYDGGGKSIATVAAFAYTGYKFVNWTKNGIEISTDNPYSFTVIEDVELVANFEEGVGIVETVLPNINVYPNPTTGELRIESRETRVENVVVYDIFGKNQKIGNWKTENAIDISNLPTGVYLVKISTKAGEIVRKVLKE